MTDYSKDANTGVVVLNGDKTLARGTYGSENKNVSVYIPAGKAFEVVLKCDGVEYKLVSGTDAAGHIVFSRINLSLDRTEPEAPLEN